MKFSMTGQEQVIMKYMWLITRGDRMGSL